MARSKRIEAYMCTDRDHEICKSAYTVESYVKCEKLYMCLQIGQFSIKVDN